MAFVRTESRGHSRPGEGSRSATPEAGGRQINSAEKAAPGWLYRNKDEGGEPVNGISQKNSNPAKAPRAEMREKQQMDENPTRQRSTNNLEV